MSKETFLGNNISILYRQIMSKYPKGVKFISTKQLRSGNKTRYTITFNTIDSNDETETKKTMTPTIEKSNFENNDALLKEIEGLEKELEKLEAMGNRAIADKSCIEILKQELYTKGMDANWLDTVHKTLIENEIIEDKKLIMHYILDEIDASLAFSKHIKQPPRIIMMVGPTGVGKTTAIAKMATYYKEQIDMSKMAFINLDHNRVAASEQLKSYADLMNIDYMDTNHAIEFAQELDAFSDKDLIFVDTGGISPFDINKLLETVAFIREASSYHVSVTLVLSATFKKEDLRTMYDHFYFLSSDHLIITKFDETSSISALVDFLRSCQTPLYYFSAGENVSNDLIAASSDYLINRLAKEWQNIECEARL